MRIKLILAVVMVLLSWPAMAQVGTPVTVYDGTTPVSTSHPLPVTGSFSATLSGFTPNLNFATLTASASSGSVALPAGVTVFFQNAGTTTASCTLGIGSATAVANEIQVPANSGVPVTVGSNTFGACIDQTGSASNLIVLAGGSGLGTPFGGGSSGGSSSNASVSATGSAVPASATYIAINAGGTLTGWTGAVTNAGTFAVQATLQASATTAIGKVDPNTIATWGLAAPGSAAPTNGQMVGGSDGTDLRALLTNTSGNLLPISKIWDGTNTAAVKAASTAAAMTDPGVVVQNYYEATALFGTSLTNAHTCSTGGYSIISCLGQIDDDVKGSVAAGANIIGKVGIDQTTPGTTNGVQVNAALPAGTNLIGNTGQVYPAGSTPITASTTGTTTATTATLAANASLHTYICGFSIRANAAAAATNNATVTGTVTGTLNFTQWTAPSASGLGVTEEVFSPCVISSAVNTGIAVVSGAPGTSGVVSVTAWGYQL